MSIKRQQYRDGRTAALDELDALGSVSEFEQDPEDDEASDEFIDGWNAVVARERSEAKEGMQAIVTLLHQASTRLRELPTVYSEEEYKALELSILGSMGKAAALRHKFDPELVS